MKPRLLVAFLVMMPVFALAVGDVAPPPSTPVATGVVSAISTSDGASLGGDLLLPPGDQGRLSADGTIDPSDPSGETLAEVTGSADPTMHAFSPDSQVIVPLPANRVWPVADLGEIRAAVDAFRAARGLPLFLPGSPQCEDRGLALTASGFGLSPGQSLAQNLLANNATRLSAMPLRGGVMAADIWAADVTDLQGVLRPRAIVGVRVYECNAPPPPPPPIPGPISVPPSPGPVPSDTPAPEEPPTPAPTASAPSPIE